MVYKAKNSNETEYLGFNCPKWLKKSIEEYIKASKDGEIGIEALQFETITDYVVYWLLFANFILRGGIDSEKTVFLFNSMS